MSWKAKKDWLMDQWAVGLFNRLPLVSYCCVFVSSRLKVGL